MLNLNIKPGTHKATVIEQTNYNIKNLKVCILCSDFTRKRKRQNIDLRSECSLPLFELGFLRQFFVKKLGVSTKIAYQLSVSSLVKQNS